MRLKQLLGILLPLVLAIAAAASESQLTQVGIGTQANATTLTLHATGAFTHSEYRPTENLMLVDLAGVSAATMDDRTQTVNLPGVVSYRVVGYKTADGANVARLELSLTPGATVGVRQKNNDLVLRVSGSSAKRAQTEAQPANVQKVSRRSQTATVQKVNVVRGRNSIDVEILATGVLEPKALRLSQPERLVVDLPNAVPLLRQHTIPVNAAEVKMVRMSRYQSAPPVTRLVVDLGSARDWDLVPAGKKLTVKLHAPQQAAQAAAPAPANKPVLETAAAEMAEETKLADTKAQEIVIVQPKYHEVPATGSTPAPQSAQAQPAQAQPTKPQPAERAGVAAAKFSPGSPNPELALSPTSASLRPQVGNNLNFHQQVGPQATAPAPVLRPKYTGEPISVNLKDVDLKDFFRLIHEISGLNVVLDPNVRGTLTIVLDDVPWDQALDIVLKNNGLDRQLEGNVLRIATVETLRKEADARRAQLEAQALAVEKVTVTRFLSYAHAKDVVPTLKKFLSQRGDVVSDDRTNALIIDDIPSSIPRIDELLGKLDRKTQEVEIEARVVAATRSFARDIGTQVAFGYGTATGPHSVGGSTQVPPGASELLTPPGNFFVVGDPTTGDPLPIPLFSNLGATGPTSGAFYNYLSQNFRLDFILTMAESRGLLKILSRPRVVTQNNIQALVRQGVRIPIVTQAQLGGPPTVTYVDAFLRLTVTPQITIEGTIFLNVDVENTVPDFGRTIQGNPTLITQQATTQVLVTDGGTVVIGGVIQTQNSVNVRQVPLLGNIPILGNLFKNRVVSTSTQELIFFITPKIIQT
ncbi:MAG: type IV pilus secretin PilQ [Acidobacteriales bacterium]|nr:type IV pilus secretin PilQ [Terriglobales bacterium]